MAYRYDNDLEFLKYCSNDDLDILVGYLTTDKDGRSRYAETLTSDSSYKKYYPNHVMYYDRIAEELQRFGGNTFVNIFRNSGVTYREILIDAAKKLNVNFNKNSNIERIEECFVNKVLEDSLEEMSKEELDKLLKELKVSNLSGTKAGAIIAIQALVKAGGFKSYQLLVIIANTLAKQILGRGLYLPVNALITKTLSNFVCPLSWFITGAWMMIDIAGTAYRVTIPCCIQIAYMRMKRQLNP